MTQVYPEIGIVNIVFQLCHVSSGIGCPEQLDMFRHAVSEHMLRIVAAGAHFRIGDPAPDDDTA